MSNKIFLVDSEITHLESLKKFLTKEGYDVTTTLTAENALERINDKNIDLLITDIALPGISGIELLKRIKIKRPDLPVIITTAYASLETAVESLRAGAYDYITKPIIHEELKQIIKKIPKDNNYLKETVYKKNALTPLYSFNNLIGQNAEFLRTIEETKKISNSQANVLIIGETGTGKELLARAIHYHSDRAVFPFIPINCSAIPDNLFESELFGYIRGSFTGAYLTKKGLFEEANGGTVLLDEIAELSQHLQAKILRVLEDKEIRAIGSNQSNRIDIRFISATNKDLLKETLEGRFRDDLYYRLNVITVKLPPLRERKDDIPLLIDYFIKKFSEETAKQIKAINQDALDILINYHWPGNIRELQNIIQRAVLMSDDGIITPTHIPKSLYIVNPSLTTAIESNLSISEYTRSFIKRYEKTHSEQEIADMLGITRKSLWEKRKKWGLIRKNNN